VNAIGVFFSIQLDDKRASIKNSVSEATYRRYGKATSRVLSLGCEITDLDRADFAAVLRRYPTLIRERDGVTPARAPEEDDDDEPAADPTINHDPSSFSRPVFSEDSDPAETDKTQCTLNQVKAQAVNIIAYSSADLAPFIMEDLRGLKAMTYMLHRAALAGKKDDHTQQLAPLLMGLSGIAKESVVASALLKAAIFGRVAFDGTPGNEGNTMKPAGHHPNPYLLRNVLIKNLTSFNDVVNRLTGEFLFLICDNNSGEYIRLTGFGNAVGLLANKGMPGFTGLTSNALNLSDLQKMADEAKRKRGDEHKM